MEKCKKDNGPWLKAVCKACPRRKIKGSAYVSYLLRLHLFRLGGYPFAANDLALEIWQDLGVVAQYFESRKMSLI